MHFFPKLPVCQASSIYQLYHTRAENSILLENFVYDDVKIVQMRTLARENVCLFPPFVV